MFFMDMLFLVLVPKSIQVTNFDPKSLQCCLHKLLEQILKRDLAPDDILLRYSIRGCKIMAVKDRSH